MKPPAYPVRQVVGGARLMGQGVYQPETGAVERHARQILALTHAIEAFVSVGAHPLTDANALEAIRLINLWLPGRVPARDRRC
jgi:hypothetical protein